MCVFGALPNTLCNADAGLRPQEEALGKLAESEDKVAESTVQADQGKTERAEQTYKGEIDRVRSELCVASPSPCVMLCSRDHPSQAKDGEPACRSRAGHRAPDDPTRGARPQGVLPHGVIPSLSRETLTVTSTAGGRPRAPRRRGDSTQGSDGRVPPREREGQEAGERD